MKSRAKEYQWHIEWREPSELIPYEYNAKLHDDKQVKNIANSIKRFGLQQPAVVTNDDVLIIGHGRRLAALLGIASCMFSDIEYVETDPSTQTYQGLVKLKRFLRLGDQYKQYNLPFEELEVKENYFDFVFTSPPYFDTERYADEDTQSFKRYNSFETWRDAFLKPMIDKILFCMKDDGKCLLNVGNAIYKIDEAIESYLDSKHIAHRRVGDFKIGGDGIGARTGEDGEPFILFGKH